MSRKDLEYAEAEAGSETRVYRLTGHLYGTEAGYAFQEAVRRTASTDMKRFVIDLSGVERIDSCGIGILAASIFSVQKAGGGMVLAALPEHIQRMLGLTMFLDHVAHAETVDDALAKVAGMELSGGSTPTTTE